MHSNIFYNQEFDFASCKKLLECINIIPIMRTLAL